MSVFPSPEALRLIVQAAAGVLVPVAWEGSKEAMPGFSGLGVDGFPLAGMPAGPPALTADSGLAVKVTLSMPAWAGRGVDDTRRAQNMSAVESAGAAPPVITISGTPTNAARAVDVRVTLAGARGVWTGEWSIDLGVTWHAFTSAATLALTGSGLTLAIATGNVSLNNTWTSRPIQTLTQVGLRHFTLSIKVETEGSMDTWAIAERIRAYLTFPSTHADLRAAKCALRDVEPLREIKVAAWDEHSISAVVLDVFLTFGMEAEDTRGETGTDVPNNWIETVAPLTFTEE